MIFPANCEGFVNVGPSYCADANAGGGTGTLVNNVGIICTDENATIVPLWQASHDYVVGDLVRGEFDSKYIYRCVVAGHSGSTNPLGNPFPTTPQRWSPNATYAVGKFIFPTRSSSQYGLSAYQVTSANGNTTAGTLGVSGATAPTFPVTEW